MQCRLLRLPVPKACRPQLAVRRVGPTGPGHLSLVAEARRGQPWELVAHREGTGVGGKPGSEGRVPP